MNKRHHRTDMGLKPRFKREKQGQHGPVKRIVGDTPMKTFAEAVTERLDRDGWIEAEHIRHEHRTRGGLCVCTAAVASHFDKRNRKRSCEWARAEEKRRRDESRAEARTGAAAESGTHR